MPGKQEACYTYVVTNAGSERRHHYPTGGPEPAPPNVARFTCGGAWGSTHVTKGPAHLAPSLHMLYPQLHEYSLSSKHIPLWHLVVQAVSRSSSVLLLAFLVGLSHSHNHKQWNRQRRYSPG